MATPARPDPPRDPIRQRPPFMTMDEYLAFDEAHSVRYEFVAGEVFAMSGVSLRHGRISGNVFGCVWTSARGGPCRVHQSEVKLRLKDCTYYPDVMGACGPEPSDPKYEEAPSLLVEVVSPSTSRTDRRERLAAYREIQTLDTYLVIEQDRRLVDRYFRDEQRTWRRETLVNDGSFVIPTPALTLTLDEIYEGVELPPLEEVLRVYEAAEAYG